MSAAQRRPPAVRQPQVPLASGVPAERRSGFCRPPVWQKIVSTIFPPLCRERDWRSLGKRGRNPRILADGRRKTGPCFNCTIGTLPFLRKFQSADSLIEYWNLAVPPPCVTLTMETSRRIVDFGFCPYELLMACVMFSI